MIKYPQLRVTIREDGLTYERVVTKFEQKKSVTDNWEQLSPWSYSPRLEAIRKFIKDEDKN